MSGRPTREGERRAATGALTLGTSVRRLRRVQRLSASVDAAWRFFSDPANLARITPPWLGFEVTSPLPDHIHSGQIVTDRVRPLLGVPVTWVTELVAVDPPYRFVDTQRVGPYSFWHHQHHLREVDGGVEVEDLVHYALPFGPFGVIVDRLIVLPRLHRIFAYRRQVLADTFGELATPGALRSSTTPAGVGR
jgi:ligand-binding SRPBCC domain-containing protein